MKSLITSLFLSIILISCSSTVVQVVKIDSTKDDPFYKESLLRYSKDRLSALLNNAKYKEISGCHLGKIDESIELLKHKYPKYKTDVEYWLHVGNCYYLQGKYSKAQFFYNFSIPLAGKDKKLLGATYNNLAMIEIQNRNYSNALSLLKQAISANNELITPKFNIAQLYLKFSLASSALFHLESIIKQSSTNDEILSSLGTAHLLDNNPTKAIDFFKKISIDKQKRENIAINYAISLVLVKKYFLAKEILSNVTTMGDLGLSETTTKLKDKIDKEIKAIEENNEKRQINKKS